MILNCISSPIEYPESLRSILESVILTFQVSDLHTGSLDMQLFDVSFILSMASIAVAFCGRTDVDGISVGFSVFCQRVLQY